MKGRTVRPGKWLWQNATEIEVCWMKMTVEKWGEVV